MNSTKRSTFTRPMKLEDSVEISRLHGLAARGPVDAGFLRLLEAHIMDGESACFVAEFEGRVVGFIIARLLTLSFEQEKGAWIVAMGVAPGVAEQDIGVELAAEILRYCETRGISGVHASVKWNSGDRLSLFRLLGFERSEFMNLTKKLN